MASHTPASPDATNQPYTVCLDGKHLGNRPPNPRSSYVQSQALSGNSAARLLRHLAMPASADTVLRLIRLLPLPEREVPRVVSVDDWAKRKGHTYGTIVVDPERHRVLDLLPDRAAETLADWLRAWPGIEVVARDLAETRSVCGWLG